MDLTKYIGRNFKLKHRDGSLSEWTDKVVSIFEVNHVGLTLKGVRQVDYTSHEILVKGAKTGFVHNFEECAFETVNKTE